MKKFLSLLIVLGMLFVASNAFALNVGLSYGNSNYNNSTGNVTTGTNSFHGVGVLFYGSATGSNYAGGQALTTNNQTIFTQPLPGNVTGGATQNSGAAYGGFTFNISGLAGAVAGTSGNVSQWSINNSNTGGSIIGATGSAGSYATQNSAAGFIGANAALFNGNCNFNAASLVAGGTYSYSYKGIDPNGIAFVGTTSGAGNSANTTTTGNYGCGYAGGNGSTSGGSAINGTNGSTSGTYGGQFSYSGNGTGNVAGGSVSTYTALPNGATYGTQTSISVNVTAN